MKKVFFFLCISFVSIGYTQDIKTLTAKAKSGNLKAQFELAFCYYDGDGVEQSYSKATYWFEKAAKQGNASSQYNLGSCYYQGKGVEQSYSKAIYWYKKAAEQNLPNAQKET